MSWVTFTDKRNTYLPVGRDTSPKWEVSMMSEIWKANIVDSFNRFLGKYLFTQSIGDDHHPDYRFFDRLDR